MPTYEYQCKSCDHRFEVWQKMTDEPLTVCPECNGAIRRVLFPAGIVFKGSGFYKTDHGSGAVVAGEHNNGQNGGKEGVSKTENASETKSDEKSAKEKVSSSTTSESKAAAAAD
ncbi:MAG TPA: FmdB family zinc ribbon protein [Ktedonobacteraceae bacterium]|jgi:putative FmdB family regulatory protein|nr:FmdB family zinc ribbon protein [Ktedonobacteraceae bacterium]